jgi:hypothetical protein
MRRCEKNTKWIAAFPLPQWLHKRATMLSVVKYYIHIFYRSIMRGLYKLMIMQQ